MRRQLNQFAWLLTGRRSLVLSCPVLVADFRVLKYWRRQRSTRRQLAGGFLVRLQRGIRDRESLSSYATDYTPTLTEHTSRAAPVHLDHGSRVVTGVWLRPGGTTNRGQRFPCGRAFLEERCVLLRARLVLV